jgi:TonB family protein
MRRQNPAERAPAECATAECASLAHILDTRNHRPMLRLQALQILEGVCRGLEYAHRNGRIHGDVRPEKIFVTSEGHVRLTGHGDAPTAAYASCEVLEGAPPVAADDLFSAACTGYQLLAGEPAFGACNALGAEAAGQRPARIPHLPPGQWRALDRALAFRRADRQPDIETFLNELRSQYPGQSEADATVSAMRPPIAGMEDNRGLRLPVMVAGLTGIVVLVITLGWWLLHTPGLPASAPAPPIADSRIKPRQILRREAAPVAVAATALQPTPATAPAMPAVPVAVVSPATIPQRIPTEAPRQPTTESFDEIKPPVADMASLPLSLPVPRAVVPELPDVPVPAISLPETSAADSGIHLVPFSSLKVRRYVDPDYPRNSEGIRTAGWVDVRFGIDAAGRTTAVQITAAEPAGVFEAAALAAARRWRFAPVAAPAGSGLEVRSEIRVRFIPD